MARKTMMSVRVPVELAERLKSEAKKHNEPVSRLMLRKLSDYEGWTQRADSTWDHFSLSAWHPTKDENPERHLCGNCQTGDCQFCTEPCECIMHGHPTKAEPR